jgi:hypothetical protein
VVAMKMGPDNSKARNGRFELNHLAPVPFCLAHLLAQMCISFMNQTRSSSPPWRPISARRDAPAAVPAAYP